MPRKPDPSELQTTDDATPLPVLLAGLDVIAEFVPVTFAVHVQEGIPDDDGPIILILRTATGVGVYRWDPRSAGSLAAALVQGVKQVKTGFVIAKDMP